MPLKTSMAVFIMFCNLAAGVALYPKAADAPQSYLGNFTSVGPAALSLYFAGILPTALVGLGLDKIGVLHQAISFIMMITIIGGTTGVYLAVRVIMAQTSLTFGDWLLLGLATPVYLLTAGVLNLRVLKEWLPNA
ncbi:MAG: hypothetical protein K8L91_12755 [Anaerolineae bacterium]|nr:hypothetical protein [Anaerolineae bacterium]